MDARQLRMLRELGELGSLTAVAEALHLTPSAVSQQLRHLQRPIPVPLTQREGRTLRLTEAGRALAAAGTDIEVALARARQIAQDLAREPSGTVTISGFSSAALSFFPRLAQAFPPGGNVVIAVADEDVVQDEFPRLTATYDVVVAHRLAHTRPWPKSVHVTPLLLEPLDIALPADHPLAGHERIHAEEAARHPWIATHAGFPVGALTEAIGVVAGIHVDINHRVNEFTVAAELVRAGAGLALIPRWTTPPPEGVVLRPLDGVQASRNIDALTRPETTQRAAVGAVLETLQQIAVRAAA
ncbi:LysR family transcriptional regulator [Kribbella sp. HUAS MG21]|uniref:LysR family transcriptional regulator n=1 Tax=Kribbella sp. HUAS MG21 TaxID=3160966 RepID=A0AAU7TDV2_9ACTN